MSTIRFEAYEDSTGCLYIYVLDDREVVWSKAYLDHAQEAANDWATLVNGNEPIYEGWDIDSLGYDMHAMTKIADSEWQAYLPFGVDTNKLCLVGKEFLLNLVLPA